LTVLHEFMPYLESGAAGGVTGFISGWAIKKVVKIGMFIVGLFFAGMMYLSYQGIIRVDWDRLNNSTQAAAQQGLNQLSAVANQTAAQFHAHGLVSSGIPVVMGSMFLAGFIGGLTRG